ncbi:MAG TPA: hypothetical protein PK878_09860 [bacterium]|nr:hypothetical protein [bacterium]HOL92715.1 hypothetical protein [bacterium]HPO99070.1 hypothetical protein [bacterium]
MIDISIWHNKSTSIIFYLIFFILLLSLYIPAERVDLWWHLQIGMDILENQKWPSPDDYSFTAQGSSWVVHSWGGDCILYLLFKLGGIPLLETIRVMSHAIWSLTIYFIVRKQCQRLDFSAVAAFMAMILIGFREIRPYLITELIALPVFDFILQLGYFTIPIYFFPLIILIWINIHPECIIFIVFLFIAFLERIVRFNYLSQIDAKWIKIAIISLICCMINPDPIRLFLRAIEGVQYPSGDWYSLFFWLKLYPRYYFVYFLIWFVSLAIFVFGICNSVSNRLFPLISELIIGFIATCLSFIHFRFVWLSVFPLILGIHYLRLFCQRNSNQLKKRIVLNITILAYVFLALLREKPEYPVYSLEESFPVDTMEYWEKAKLDGNVWCDWNWSGYVIWKSNGKAKVFSDTRIEPFSETVIELGRHPSQKIMLITDKLKDYDTDYLILPAVGMTKTIQQLEINKIGDIVYKGEESILIKLK